MLIQEIIQKKRDGGALSADEISQMVSGMTTGSASDAQLAAFAMAVFFRKLDVGERVALTGAMRDSGHVLAWPDLDRPVVDKHSTGGIGDNVSLMLAPALAACGAAVPMISGRGLGHTGGTLDKLDAIPGYQTQPDEDTLRRVVASVGCAVIGQTSALAPADKRLYGIRDISATVDSIDLITASILSKKLAAGLGSLILDVKCGSGAFMTSLKDARALAQSLVSVANGAGCRTAARITDMNQPLASAAGNAVEVENVVDFLTGDHVDPRLWDVTCTLGGDLLHLAGLADTAEAGHDLIALAFRSGAAAERFGRMVAELGGPVDFVENPATYLPQAAVVRDVEAGTAGYVREINPRGVGLAVIGLGGGRRVSTDDLDYSTGFSGLLPIGARTDPKTPIGRVHAPDPDAAKVAALALQKAYVIGDAAPGPDPLFLDYIEPGRSAET